MTDVPIKVDVIGYSSASFSHVAIDTLIARGEHAAMQHWDELIGIKRKLGLPQEYQPRRARRFVPAGASLWFSLDSVLFMGISDADRDYVVSKYGLRSGNTVSAKQIEESTTALGSVFLYTGVGYNLTRQGGKYIFLYLRFFFPEGKPAACFGRRD